MRYAARGTAGADMNPVLDGLDFKDVVGVVLYNSGNTWFDCKRGTFLWDENSLEVCIFERDVHAYPDYVKLMRVDACAISAVLLSVKK